MLTLGRIAFRFVIVSFRLSLSVHFLVLWPTIWILSVHALTNDASYATARLAHRTCSYCVEHSTYICQSGVWVDCLCVRRLCHGLLLDEYNACLYTRVACSMPSLLTDCAKLHCQSVYCCETIPAGDRDLLAHTLQSRVLRIQ